MGQKQKTEREKKKKKKKYVITLASYGKILGETNFQPWEFPRSGSKAKDREREKKGEREKERLNDVKNNGQATH